MIEMFAKRTMFVSLSIFVIALFIGACSANQAAPAQTASEQTADEAVSAPIEEVADEEVAGEKVAGEEAAAVPAVDTATQAEAAEGAKTFQIVQDGTQARFYIDEVLMGNDKTVIGVTSLVEGELTVDPANPATAQISTIRIDARDLTTDSDRRNGAIRRFVLQSEQDEFQYVTFEPTAIESMPASISIGAPFEFSVTGDLTIRDVTKTETFQVTVTANSADELVGLGKTTIQRADYNLTIPSVPSVANVSEEVPLEIEFVAIAAN